MSVNSMADMAYARRADVTPTDTGLGSVSELAKEKGEKPATSTPVTSAISTAAAYIPTEILTVYVAVLGTLGIQVPGELLPSASPSASASPGASAAASTTEPNSATDVASSTPFEVYVLFLVLTPLVVWGLYAAKARRAGKPIPRSIGAWPKWEMLAGFVAFAIWAAALPASPLERFDWFNAGLAGIAALVISMLLAVFAPVFTSQALADA
jgi:hypothetical protein